MQRCWQWYKIKQRLKALAQIRDYIDTIDTNVLYLEKHLYLTKLSEGFIEFGFNERQEVGVRPRYPNFQNEGQKFGQTIVSFWLKLQPEESDYSNQMADYTSDMMALLHYSDKPISLVEKKGIFVKGEFQSVKEAKRRALVLALMSYKLMKRTFISFYTDEMLQNPLILMNLRKLWSAFNHNEGQDDINKKIKPIDLERPALHKHAGLIISSEDQYLATSHPYIKIRVKTQKGNYSEPDEITEIEKDIIITSTKEEVNKLKVEAIIKEKELEDARVKKQHEVKDRIKNIGKKEPANIHIIKNNNFAIEKVTSSTES